MMAFDDEDKLLKLQYHNFHNHLVESLQELRQNDEFTDVTLTCDVRNKNDYAKRGFRTFRQFRVHKLLLCISSPYFKDLFIDNPCQNPIIMLRDTYADELEAVLNFIYNGEVQVTQSGLDEFVKTAKFLQVFDFDKDQEDLQTSTTEVIKPLSNLPSSSIRRSQRKPKPKKFDSNESSDGENFMDETETNSESFQIKSESPAAERWRGKRQSEIQESAKKKICIKSKEEESESDTLECKFCKLTFWSSHSRRLHEDNHKVDTMCEKCGNQFSHPMILDEHMKTHAEGHETTEVIETSHEVKDIQAEFEVVSEPTYAHVIDDSTGNIQIIVTEQSNLFTPNQNDAKKIKAAKPVLTGRLQVLSNEDAFSLLHLEDILSIGETTIPVRAKAGDVYAFKCNDETTIKKHLRADGYMWKNKRTQRLPNEVMHKTYFYARTEGGMTHEFMKHEYMLQNGTRVLIHYLGDETKYKDRKHGNSTRSSAYFYRTSKLVADQILEKAQEKANKKPLEVFEEIMATDPGGAEGYLSVVSKPRNLQQISNVLMRNKKKAVEDATIIAVESISEHK